MHPVIPGTFFWETWVSLSYFPASRREVHSTSVWPFSSMDTPVQQEHVPLVDHVQMEHQQIRFTGRIRGYLRIQGLGGWEHRTASSPSPWNGQNPLIARNRFRRILPRRFYAWEASVCCRPRPVPSSRTRRNGRPSGKRIDGKFVKPSEGPGVELGPCLAQSLFCDFPDIEVTIRKRFVEPVQISLQSSLEWHEEKY